MNKHVWIIKNNQNHISEVVSNRPKAVRKLSAMGYTVGEQLDFTAPVYWDNEQWGWLKRYNVN